MKKTKIAITFILLSFLGFNEIYAQDEFTPGIGIALKSSTIGYGGDIVYNFQKKMSLRLGYDQLKLKTDFTFDEEDVSYDASADYKSGGLSLLFDYYLGKRIFVTVGASSNMFKTIVNGAAASSYQYGDITIPKEKIGEFTFQIEPGVKISPYFGFGFGRTLGLRKKVGFSYEIGAIYQGSPNLSITSTGLISPTSNPDQGHEARLEKQIDQYSVFPVIKFSLSYKFVSFKKAQVNQ